MGNHSSAANTISEKAVRGQVQRKQIDLLIFSITLLSAWLLLSWVKNVQDTVLQIMLYPHKLAAEIFFNTAFQYYEGIGYIASNSTYAIGRECMGYNFILLLYVMNACTYIRHFTGLRKLLWLAASLSGAVLAGTFVSILRIIASIPFSIHQDFHLIHLGIGTTIYLFVLLADFIGLNKLFGRIHHEDQ